MYQSIRQEVTFKAKPETIYSMLMDAKAHSTCIYTDRRARK